MVGSLAPGCLKMKFASTKDLQHAHCLSLVIGSGSIVFKVPFWFYR